MAFRVYQLKLYSGGDRAGFTPASLFSRCHNESSQRAPKGNCKDLVLNRIQTVARDFVIVNATKKLKKGLSSDRQTL